MTYVCTRRGIVPTVGQRIGHPVIQCGKRFWRIEIIGEIAEEIIASTGATVERAWNGLDVLDLLEGVEYQLLPTDIEEVDITKIDEVTQFVHVNRPDVVINCAGLTDVQECENNVDEAYRVNAIGVRNVALAANEVNAKVIQISTDDVFDKESRVPYNEFDNVHPRTIYGKSKVYRHPKSKRRY